MMKTSNELYQWEVTCSDCGKSQTRTVQRQLIRLKDDRFTVMRSLIQEKCAHCGRQIDFEKRMNHIYEGFDMELTDDIAAISAVLISQLEESGLVVQVEPVQAMNILIPTIIEWLIDATMVSTNAIIDAVHRASNLKQAGLSIFIPSFQMVFNVDQLNEKQMKLLIDALVEALDVYFGKPLADVYAVNREYRSDEA